MPSTVRRKQAQENGWGARSPRVDTVNYLRALAAISSKRWITLFVFRI
jgi:hypothetical protein